MAKVYIENVRDLVEKAGEIREKLALATRRIGNVHIGGPMSATDVTTAIYYKYMGFDPENLDDPNRDRFILSKGHNGILLFTIFCDMGMYDWDLLLDTYNTIGHPFGAHPNHKRVKGIEVSTGSLGHGLSWCCGIGHANRGRGIKSRIWTLLGDGEMEEGSNWEAILYAASHNLDNIVAVVDFNHASAAYETNQNERWGENGGLLPRVRLECDRHRRHRHEGDRQDARRAAGGHTERQAQRDHLQHHEGSGRRLHDGASVRMAHRRLR